MISTAAFFLYFCIFVVVQVVYFSYRYSQIETDAKNTKAFLFFVLLPYYGYGELMMAKEIEQHGKLNYPKGWYYAKYSASPNLLLFIACNIGLFVMPGLTNVLDGMEFFEDWDKLLYLVVAFPLLVIVLFMLGAAETVLMIILFLLPMNAKKRYEKQVKKEQTSKN